MRAKKYINVINCPTNKCVNINIVDYYLFIFYRGIFLRIFNNFITFSNKLCTRCCNYYWTLLDLT